MNYEQIKNDISKLTKKKFAIVANARGEGRATDKTEDVAIAEIDGALEGLKLELEKPDKPKTLAGLASSNNGPFNSLGDQLVAVQKAGAPHAQPDQRLYNIRNAATGLGETVPVEGGFLVQKDFTNQLLEEVMATGQLAKRCMPFPISNNSNGIKINAFDETSRASSRFGGIVSYWKGEADEKTASKPKFRQMDLSLKKLIGLCYSSDELLADQSALEAVIKRAFVSEFGFRIDDAIINGTGAGQPLGILNAGSLVTQDKETAQAASTLVAENIMKMLERSIGPSSNYVWLHSKSVLSSIYSMSISVGTGGIPLFIAGGLLPNQPENRLLGLPLIECEQCQVLGTAGDIILADLQNGYILAQKDNIQSDVSIHVRFIYDESVFRFVLRVDGQPSRASVLTPYKGGASYTQSHFISLATRS